MSVASRLSNRARSGGARRSRGASGVYVIHVCCSPGAAHGGMKRGGLRTLRSVSAVVRDVCFLSGLILLRPAHRSNRSPPWRLVDASVYSRLVSVLILIWGKNARGGVDIAAIICAGSFR